MKKPLYSWAYLPSPVVTVTPKKGRGKKSVANFLQKFLQAKIRQATVSMNRQISGAMFPQLFVDNPFGRLMEAVDQARAHGVDSLFVEVKDADGNIIGSWRKPQVSMEEKP
jgi:hypothetical protein